MPFLFPPTGIEICGFVAVFERWPQISDGLSNDYIY